MTEQAPLRILVLFGNIPLWGQERANIQVYERLKARGVEALFVTHKKWGHAHIQPALDARGLAWTTATFVGRMQGGFRPLQWTANLWAIVRGSVQVALIVRRFRPHGLHVANPVFFVNFIPVIYACRRLPLVYRLGDSPAVGHPLYGFLWRRLIGRRVSHFVCDSEFVRRQLTALGIEPQRATVVYPPPPDRPSAQGERFERSDIFTVAYVGQISPHKGLHLLIEAVMRLLSQGKALRLLIAGDHEWQNAYAAELMGKVRDRGFEQRIRFLGNIDNVPGLLASCDVHACPTISEEPLGLVVMEAKAAAKASIVFPSGGLVEIVRNGEDGHVCTEKTVEALEAALTWYLGDRARAEEQGLSARSSLDRLGVFRLEEAWRDIWRQVTTTA